MKIAAIFSSIPDHRVVGRCTYPLSDLLTIALLSYMCGGEDYVDMSEFAQFRAAELCLLEGCNTTPSPDTFERLMSAVSPDEIERCLIESGKALLDTLAEKQIVIDGKKLRGTNPRSRGTKGDYLMNAFVSENRLIVGQSIVKDKENEIKAIPEILDKLDIEDAIVSIDAIGTQVEIAQQITEKRGHYFLALKENQKSLYEVVEAAFKYNKPIDTNNEMEADHGRIEERICSILPALCIEEEAVRNRWSKLSTIVRIDSNVDDKTTGKHSYTTRYYISDEAFSKAAYFNMLARGHWSIENLLHWLLDVAFHEDACRARKGYAPQNLSLIRKMALQCVKEQNDKCSIKKRLFRAALSNDYLISLVKNFKF